MLSNLLALLFLLKLVKKSLLFAPNKVILLKSFEILLKLKENNEMNVRLE